ncbi:hypothetical protein KP509_27G019900 [Ceratopteris richardii]|uniref:Uncharacterized protein n=1 Tax=Ceratopteris richardii TaxID=49495 RepID=A0A8T2RGS6_CERRI|nr:hypothetical protein KP509_27G019900 [Ceratopteris richardii]
MKFSQKRPIMELKKDALILRQVVRDSKRGGELQLFGIEQIPFGDVLLGKIISDTKLYGSLTLPSFTANTVDGRSRARNSRRKNIMDHLPCQRFSSCNLHFLFLECNILTC